MKHAVMIAALTFIFLLSPGHAQLAGQLGVLDPQNANGGINPATGVAWAEDDMYRLAFYTEDKRDTLSNDIADYNEFVQGVAADSETFPDLGNAVWKVLGSTETVSARQNTGTDTNDGLPIFVLDGVTMIAQDSEDMWNGFPLRYALDDPENPNVGAHPIYYSPYLNEDGEEVVEFLFGREIATGTNTDGNIAGDPLGDPNEDGARLTVGASRANNAGRVWVRFGNRSPSGNWSFYALSEPLTVITGSSTAFQLAITPNGTNYDFTWESEGGKIYDLVSSTDLATTPSTWPVWDSNADIPSGGTTTSLEDIAVSGPARFFAVMEKTPPPLLSEDFESVTGPGAPAGWTATDSDAGTTWEVGAPGEAATGPDAAASGTQCAGTNITANYTTSAEASLVTKDFTVPATGATLKFSQYIDTEAAPSGDLGAIRLLNAADDSVLAGGNIATELQGILESWTNEATPLPAVANGLSVKLEFRFTSNDNAQVFAGFYIDNVEVIANTP